MVIKPELIAILISGVVIFAGLIVISLRRKRLVKLEDRVQINKEKMAIAEAIQELEIESGISKEGDQLTWLQRKERELEQSNTGITIYTYMIILAGSMLGIFILVYKIARITFIAIPFAFIGIKVPEKIVESRRQKNIDDFNEQLVKALRRMASVMRSGGSLKQALVDVSRSRSMPPLIRIEFRKALSDIEYGLTIEEALYKIYERTGSKDVEHLAIAVEIQRQLGGNIAEVFDSISATISNRALMESEVRATMAQVNASSTILSLLPAVIGGILYFVSPGYFDPLFNSVLGRLIFLGCVSFMAIGAYIIKRMSKIEL